jgi:hypothetical protein
MPEVAVKPAERFEWERIVRRIVMPHPVKFVALVLATYADPDGSRVRPGNPVLADVTGMSVATIKRYLSRLRRMQLIALARRGGGRGGKGAASEYQLTIPADLLDTMILLSPGERLDSGLTWMSPQSAHDNGGQPVDNSNRGLIQVISQSPTLRAHLSEPSISGLERLRAQMITLRAHSCEPLPTTYTNHPHARARVRNPHLLTWLLPHASPDRTRAHTRASHRKHNLSNDENKKPRDNENATVR